MADKNDIQRNIDSSRLITKMAAASGAVALVMLVLTEVLYAFRGGDDDSARQCGNDRFVLDDVHVDTPVQAVVADSVGGAD